jgi:hypothetical protein
MIELEIQALSIQREGLLIEVGRLIVASGFVLQRQRLAQDPHGTLLTMVVRGPSRKQRSLKVALDACERLISFEVVPCLEGEVRPHFAASRKTAYVAAPASEPVPEAAATAAPLAVATEKPVPTAPRNFDEVSHIELGVAVPRTQVEAEPKHLPEREQELEFEFLAGPPVHAPAPPTVEIIPFIEVIPLGPDEEAVEEKVMRELDDAYPQIVPHVLALDRSVEEGAREASLSLAGKLVGGWLFQRGHASIGRLGWCEAIERVGVPALGELIEVEQQGGQLHIRHSPLCTEQGRSGCMFFSGYLEGLLGPLTGLDQLSIFAVGCRSWGAGECVLAVAD